MSCAAFSVYWNLGSVSNAIHKVNRETEFMKGKLAPIPTALTHIELGNTFREISRISGLELPRVQAYMSSVNHALWIICNELYPQQTLTKPKPIPPEDFVREFVTVWRTKTYNETVTIFTGSAIDCTIDWGDNTPIEHFNSNSSPSHVYTKRGDYTVIMDGIVPSMDGYGASGGGEHQLVKVLNLGDTGLDTTVLSYAYCSILESFTVGTADISKLTSLWAWFSEIGTGDFEGAV